MNEQVITIGEMVKLDNLLDEGEYLQLGFQPSSMPLKERWRNNGLSADFMADYVTTFFPKHEDDPGSSARQMEIKSAVSYIANELLENGMKYTLEHTRERISISLLLEADRIIINATNAVDSAQSQAYQAFAEQIVSGDPMDLYMQALEASATGEGTSSGLGFLTMLNDYNAQISWSFYHTEEPRAVIATTQVRVPI